ncbi:LOW QUALITY PROTEIN: stalled ribosome sensor GCN1 [Lampetra fluviatilis]
MSMADPQGVEAVRRLASRVTSSSVRDREATFTELRPSLCNAGLPEAAVKAVCRLMCMTLQRYRDAASRRAVRETLRVLAEAYPAATARALPPLLPQAALVSKGSGPTKCSSAAAAEAVAWTCTLARAAFSSPDSQEGEAWKQLVEVQGVLLTEALGSPRRSVRDSVGKKLVRLWTELPALVERYMSTLLSGDAGASSLCLVGALVEHCCKTGHTSTVDGHKAQMIDLFIKASFLGKSKPSAHVLEHCGPLVRRLTHADFKELVLPVVVKSMLRSPENAIDAVGSLLSLVTLDLSQYAMDIGRILASQLKSNSAALAEAAGVALRGLARQCSEGDALESLLRHLFAVLNGSEGKLTVAAQKISVLSGVASLSQHVVSTGAAQALSRVAIELFVHFLQQEVHDGTLVSALAALSAWCARLAAPPAALLLAAFRDGATRKGATSATRLAYLQCMNATFHGDSALAALELLPCLSQALERAAAQGSQVAMVTEGASAALLVCRLAVADAQVDTKLSALWPLIVDEKKQLFTADKFLAQGSDEAFCTVLQLSERLLLDHPQTVTAEKARPYVRAVLMGLLHRAWAVRRRALQTTRKLLSSAGGMGLAHGLLGELKLVLAGHKVVAPELLVNESGEPTDLGRSYAAPRLLAGALWAVTATAPPPHGAAAGAAAETEALAQDALLPAHHPSVVSVRPGLWLALLARWGLNTPLLVAKLGPKLLPGLLATPDASPASLQAVVTLVGVAPRPMLPPVVGHVRAALSEPALLQVTRDDAAVMRTPPGTLWDRSVIDSSKKEASGKRSGNMKRENKAYSYQEQILELEIKEELKKKKKGGGGGGKDAAPQLTAKQQEMVEEQLKKEAETRARLQQMDRRLASALALLGAMVRARSPRLACHAAPLVAVLTPLLASPLAAPRALDALLSLPQLLMPPEHAQLGEVLGYVTMRLLSPECEVPAAWCQEPLSDAAERVVAALYALTVSGPGPLPAPAFALAFPLLRTLLLPAVPACDVSEETRVAALLVMAAHAQLRSRQQQHQRQDEEEEEKGEEEEEIDENGPELLPRKDMMLLLTSLVATASPRLQVTAASALTALCTSASGNPGCACAEQAEVEVLLAALLSPCTALRDAALRGLLELELVLPTPDGGEGEAGVHVLRRVWLARFDPEEENSKLAHGLWEALGLELQPALCSLLLRDVLSHVEAVRVAGAAALAAALEPYPELAPDVLVQLRTLYQEKLYRAPPVLDGLGRVVTESPPDEWEARCGVALALAAVAGSLGGERVTPLFRFFVPEALGDRHAEVRRRMLDAALAALNHHGKECVNELLPLLEDSLRDSPDDASYDAVRQGVVILMGSLAKHLDRSDPKVKPIVAKLVAALSTPSQQVQESVANCLAPLVPAMREDAPAMARHLMALLLEAESYGERRGAAHGLAGLVRGLGILALKQLDVMSTLTDAIQDKKHYRRREGALFGFEMLCSMLGRLFEPYVVHALPHLLLCLGDGNQYVREAAEETAKAVMRNLSTHGVKLVLPSLLAALEEDSWRTKTGSVELLGSMAYCAPKQLSACLPSIVPKLTQVLTDSHVKVQQAGQQALKLISSVIRNPEIQAITPVILEALTDPSRQVHRCLHTLLQTQFVHFIDAPSLALIMPIVQRAFLDRSTDTRKMAAQIIGNMYSLTDQKDLAPYLPSVIPGLKTSLLDPVPEVRAVSAKALGAMVKGMGEESFEDLMPWLMQTLTSEQSSVDRSGAAQGLSEVLVSLGVEKLDKLMPEIVANASKADLAPHVRDGYIMMFIFLPATFGERFTPYVGPIIPAILKALADENEFVRDTALRAGQRIISTYAEKAITLLLPQLEDGLFNDSWRIRFSSVQLLGDLLFHISGVSGKMTTETASEDDNFGTVQSTKAIISALGPERRNRVLSGLYMGRSDVALVVRQAALHVWKVVVANTPRTLREILPTLFGLLLGFLASTNYDKRQIAARTLGDLVRKLGEKILPEIIPILEAGLCSEHSDERQGVCIGLSEIMRSTSRDAVLLFAGSLVPTVRRALCDPLPEVREAAARTFEQLHTTVGQTALDDILPSMLQQLDDEAVSEFALDGLKQVMAVKSRVVLPYLIPKLTTPPVSVRVLAFLSAVAGDALTRHLPVVLAALLTALRDASGTPGEQQELEHCQAVLLSVTDPAGVRVTVDTLLEASRSPEAAALPQRRAATALLGAVCARGRADLSDHVPSLIRGLLRLFADEDDVVLNNSWDALHAVIKKLDAAEQMRYIRELRQAIRLAASDLLPGQHLPGFCLPKKGASSILPVLREGVLSGGAELKEEAAHGLGEVVRLTAPDALRPSVVSITGPLIRILGDRFAWSVKVALLDTLALLLAKVGMQLKPFLPQLQTTFTKALQDPNRLVRLKAAEALGHLVPIHAKVDPLFTELLAGAKAAEDAGVRETTLQALRFTIAGAGGKVDPSVRRSVTTALLGMLGHEEDPTRAVGAGCLGELCAFLPEEELQSVLLQHVLVSEQAVDWMTRAGRALALCVALKSCPSAVCSPERAPRVLDCILANANADRVLIAVSGVRAAGYLTRHQMEREGGGGFSPKLVTVLVKGLQHQSSEVRLVAAQVSCWVHRAPGPEAADAGAAKPLLKALLDGYKDKNTAVRAASELALVSLLRLRHGDATCQAMSKELDPTSLELLNDCCKRSLRKLASQPEPSEHIDDTILT